MACGGALYHSFQLVAPSPLPVLGACGGRARAPGLVAGFHGHGYRWSVPVVLIVPYTMISWWREVIREAEHEGHHTPVVQLHLRYGMVMFIASEVMFFVAWFWAYFNAALYPTEAIGHVWPPATIQTFDPWEQIGRA